MKSKAEIRPKTTFMNRRNQKKRMAMSATTIDRLSKPKKLTTNENDEKVTQMRRDVSEYVKEALIANQKIPYIENLKADYDKKIYNSKINNSMHADVIKKTQELKKLEDQLKIMQMANHWLPSSKMPVLDPNQIELEKMNTETYQYMISRDKRKYLKKK